MRPLVVVMTGVAGSGKSAIGRLVAQDLGWPFADGDDLHSAENVAKMRSGRPLTDAERGPWLHQIARWIGEHSATGGVIACSALRRAYRDLLRNDQRDVRFACLTAPRDVLAARLAARPSHFMPASLLDSQLDTFEPLRPDEPGATFDTSGTPEQIAAAVVAALEGSAAP